MNSSYLPWIFLLVSLFVLVVVPFLYGQIIKRGEKLRYLKKIMVWSLAALISFHMLPELIATLGYRAVLIALLGAGTAVIVEVAGAKVGAARYMGLLALLGLSLHGLMDGFAIKTSDGNLVHGIAEVVVIHRIFAGVFIWQICVENYSKLTGTLILSLLGLMTVFGFFLGQQMLQNSYHVTQNIYLVQAFALGCILHIAFHVKKT